MDEDLAGLFPEPPPPRTAPRDAAIALALRRFDGDAGAAAPARASGASAGWPMRWGPVAAFASLLLVALFSVQIWLRTPGGPWAGADRPAASTSPRAADQSEAVAAAAPAPCAGAECGSRAASGDAAVQPAAAAAADEAAAARPAAPEVVAQGPAAPPAAARPVIASAAPPAPPPPASGAPPAMKGNAAARAAPAEGVVVTGTRIAPQTMDSASAVTVIAEEELADSQIVVTGAQTRRRGASPASARGDWNACTVEDPEQSLRGCKALLGTGRKGAAGEAATQLSEGLQRAWQQDWQGATEAFDRAIALNPRNAFAWLNRGLAHKRRGDLDRAAADLDQAVRLAPRTPRVWYQRSLVRRMTGDEGGARRDTARAEALDPRYSELVD
jgi:hypothetical protein